MSKSVWWFHPEANSVRDEEIRRVRDAFRRKSLAAERLRALFVPGSCCPSCSVPGYSEAFDSADRTAARLMTMLRRRGRPEDRQEARRIDFDYPSRASIED